MRKKLGLTITGDFDFSTPSYGSVVMGSVRCLFAKKKLRQSCALLITPAYKPKLKPLEAKYPHEGALPLRPCRFCRNENEKRPALKGQAKEAMLPRALAHFKQYSSGYDVFLVYIEFRFFSTPCDAEFFARYAAIRPIVMMNPHLWNGANGFVPARGECNHVVARRSWRMKWLRSLLPLVLLAGQAAAQAPSAARLSLDEIKQQVLANNKLLQLAALNVQSKGYAIRAARALYFPQIIGQEAYFHFNDDLGTVITTPGRTVTGPRGRLLVGFPSLTRNVAILNQDSNFTTVAAVQPITDLLKVRQGVRLAQADEQIAQAQLEKGRRELLSGVEQLFWGLLTAQRLRAGAIAAASGVEALAKTGNLEAKVALVEGQQGLEEVSKQVADLQEQLAILLGLPSCTQFELVEPPLPPALVKCADEAVALALANSPEIREAEQTVAKACAAVKAAKLDYVPSIAAVGGWMNQTGADYIQPNIGFVGVIGSYTFVDWGKRRNTIRERDQLVAMAGLKVQDTQDTVRQNALKAFREYQDSQGALKLAGQMVALRAEAQRSAKDPAAQFKAGKDAMDAQVAYAKADLAVRIAYVKLTSLLGKE